MRRAPARHPSNGGYRRPRAAGLLCLALGAAFLGGGCGGQGQDAACDDASFRAQDEEVYVARSTAVNALGGGATVPTLVRELRSAAEVLGHFLDANPPCSVELERLAHDERAAVTALTAAADALQAGASEAELERVLRPAVSALESVERRLQPTS